MRSSRSFVACACRNQRSQYACFHPVRCRIFVDAHITGKHKKASQAPQHGNSAGKCDLFCFFAHSTLPYVGLIMRAKGASPIRTIVAVLAFGLLGLMLVLWACLVWASPVKTVFDNPGSVGRLLIQNPPPGSMICVVALLDVVYQLPFVKSQKFVQVSPA